MQPDAQQGQLDSVQGDLEDNPEVEEYRYLDQQEAYDEFKQLFRDSARHHRHGRARGPADRRSGSCPRTAAER